MTIKQKIKAECINRGIKLIDFLKEAGINRESFYGSPFREIWKERVATTFQVDENKFFEGYEDEIYIRKTKKPEVNYEAIKPLIITELENGWLKIKDIQELGKLNSKQAISLISNLKNQYNIDIRSVAGQVIKKEFHITHKIERIKEVIPISELPKIISKSNLLTWGIFNSGKEFKTSKDLVNYAKANDKQVFEKKIRGEVYYL